LWRLWWRHLKYQTAPRKSEKNSVCLNLQRNRNNSMPVRLRLRFPERPACHVVSLGVEDIGIACFFANPITDENPWYPVVCWNL
jgi:hypothetical protein